MTLRATCPNCRGTFTLRDEHLGKQLRCSKCKTTFTVPLLSAEAEIEPDPEGGASAEPGRRGLSPRAVKGAGVPMMVVLIGAAVFLVGMVATGATVFFLMRLREDKVAVAPPLAPAADRAVPAKVGDGQKSSTDQQGVVPPVNDPLAKASAKTAEPSGEVTSTQVEVLPVRVIAGRFFSYRLPGYAGNATFQLVSGPPGLTINAPGQVSWLPPRTQSGPQDFTVRVTIPAGSTDHRYRVNVGPAPVAVAGGAGPTVPPVDQGSVPGPTNPTVPRLNPGDTLPQKAMSGQPFTYQVPHAEGQTIQLMHGPEGLTISPDGKLTWTPGPGSARTEMVTAMLSPGSPLLFRIAVEDDPANTMALPGLGGWVMLGDGVTLIAALSDKAQLVYIDTVANKELKRVDLAFKPGALAYQGNVLLAAAQGGALLYLLDLQTGAMQKEIKVPEGAVTDLACHPKQGLAYVTTNTQRIVAIDPVKGTATATRARGMFLAADPVQGDALFVATQPKPQDVLVIKELSRGRFMVSENQRGDRALLTKLAIKGDQLEVVGVNENAATNGFLVRISRDGKRVAVVGGGGYRAPDGGAPGGFKAYGIGLFDSADIKTLLGVVEVGAYPLNLAFHPVLDIGVAEQTEAENALHLFNSNSLAQISRIPLAKQQGSPAFMGQNVSRLLTFGAKGTKVLYYDGAGSGVLHAIPLPLSEQDREALEKAYGK